MMTRTDVDDDKVDKQSRWTTIEVDTRDEVVQDDEEV